MLFARVGLPYALATALMWVYTQSDVLVTTSILGPTAGGSYYGNYRVYAILSMVAIASSAHWSPELFGSFNTDNITATRHLIQNRTLKALTIGIALGAMTWFLGPSLTTVLFGGRFPAELHIHRMLGTGLPAYSVGVVLGAALTANGKQPRRTILQSLAAISNVALNLLLIPRGGIVVAAATTTLAAGLLAILYLLECERSNVIPTQTRIITLLVGLLALAASIATLIQIA